MSASPVVLDCAGPQIGGARRLRDELDRYLRDRPDLLVEVIGREQRLTARWLVEREASARGAGRTIALNNVSFCAAGRERFVHVHGAHHFLYPDEVRRLGRRIPAGIHVQAAVVRAAVRRADFVAVPAYSMVERVLRVVPSVRDRLVVAPNPVTVAVRAQRPPATAGRGAQILCPVLITPHKAMDTRLGAALAAVDLLAREPGQPPATIAVTATAEELAAARIPAHPRLRPLGRQPAAVLTGMMSRADAVLYPTDIESFGYPIAEARAMGIPVLGLDTDHNREIGGAALVPYPRETPEDLAAAISAALRAAPAPEPGAFLRERFFDRFFGPL